MVRVGPFKRRRDRKLFSRGVWAPAAHISHARASFRRRARNRGLRQASTSGLGAARSRAIGLCRRIHEAVYRFLAFDARHDALARQMARAIADHATPIGSGTVARTERIPVEQRAESAVIAWMRHQTTGYDHYEDRACEGPAPRSASHVGGPLARALGEVPSRQDTAELPTAESP